MIAQGTAARIWSCYREIEVATELLSKMAESRSDHVMEEERAGMIQDAFGRYSNLQLGVPSGSNAHRLFAVSPALAESVIRAHIANMQSALAEANEQARLELDSPPR